MTTLTFFSGFTRTLIRTLTPSLCAVNVALLGTLTASGSALAAPALSHFTYAAQFGDTYRSANQVWGRGQEIDVARNRDFEQTELQEIVDGFGISRGVSSANSYGVLRAFAEAERYSGRILWASDARVGESIRMYQGNVQDPYSGRVAMAVNLSGVATVYGGDADAFGMAGFFFEFRAYNPGVLENCLRFGIPFETTLEDIRRCTRQRFYEFRYFGTHVDFSGLSSFLLEFDAPSEFEWIARLQAYVDTGEEYGNVPRGATAAFGNSAHLSLVVPDGVLFTSGSGSFNGSSNVSAPGSLALALVAFLISFVARRPECEQRDYLRDPPT